MARGREKTGPRMAPWAAMGFAVALGVGLVGSGFASSDGEDEDIALCLAELLRSARTVISANQELINNAVVGNKGLTGDAVLGKAMEVYQQATGRDPRSYDPVSRLGRLIRAQMAAVKEVVDENQETINRRGIGFKGFVPAAFARLVNESFQNKMGQEVEIKVTAPPELVRNRKSRPDAWETEIIRGKFLAADWPRGKVFSGAATRSGRQAFRVLVPEYYSAGCLECHGDPKGQFDVTGYPKEGGKLDQLGGVISITVFR